MKSWEAEWLMGKAGAWLASALMPAVAVAVLSLCGCHTYTVVPADYHAVPVRQTGEHTYEHAVEDATGWYIPDSLMLELLDAK